MFKLDFVKAQAWGRNQFKCREKIYSRLSVTLRDTFPFKNTKSLFLSFPILNIVNIKGGHKKKSSMTLGEFWPRFGLVGCPFRFIYLVDYQTHFIGP